MMELHLHSPIYFHGIMLDYLSTKIILPFTTLMNPSRVLYESGSHDTMTATEISGIVTHSLSLSLSCFDLRLDRKTGYLHRGPSFFPSGPPGKCSDGTLEQHRFLPYNSPHIIHNHRVISRPTTIIKQTEKESFNRHEPDHYEK
jgi:hypothetical protein